MYIGASQLALDVVDKNLFRNLVIMKVKLWNVGHQISKY